MPPPLHSRAWDYATGYIGSFIENTCVLLLRAQYAVHTPAYNTHFTYHSGLGSENLVQNEKALKFNEKMM